MAVTIYLSNSTVAEAASSYQYTVGILTVEGLPEGETLSGFSLENDYYKEWSGPTFTIVYSEGQYLLKAKASALDFEDPAYNNFALNITALGSGGQALQTSPFTIQVTDANDQPLGVTLTGGSVDSTATAGATVATLAAKDQDAVDTHTYTLYETPYAYSKLIEYVRIENNKIVLIKDLDSSLIGTHKLDVAVRDEAGLSSRSSITLTITSGDVSDPLPETPQPPAPPAPTPVEGTKKNNKLYGTDGADAISGLGGNDKIYGQGGDDILSGGAGKDMLYGGAGSDTFVFDTKVKKGHFDHIKDFNVAEDTIQVSTSALSSFKVKMTKKDALGAMKGGKKGAEKKSTFKLDKVIKKGKMDDKFFSLADKAKDSTDLFYYNSKNGYLYIDADGSGKGKGVAIAKLDKGLSITADDFLFI